MTDVPQTPSRRPRGRPRIHPVKPPSGKLGRGRNGRADLRRNDFVVDVARRTAVSILDVARVYDMLVKKTLFELFNGRPVVIQGFGRFGFKLSRAHRSFYVVFNLEPLLARRLAALLPLDEIRHKKFQGELRRWRDRIRQQRAELEAINKRRVAHGLEPFHVD